MRNRAQIWIETVIYTLIGLTIIAIIMSIAMPELEEAKEKGIVSQTADALNILQSEIEKVETAGGNIKVAYFKIAKGRLEIIPEEDTIVYILENTKLKLSEPGEEFTEDKLTLITEEYGKNYNIRLELRMGEEIDLTFNGGVDKGVLQTAPSPYEIQIENVGDNQVGERIHIDLRFI